MIVSKDEFYSIYDSPSLVNVTKEWCNDPINKYSSSKWKKLVILLFNQNYSIKYIIATTGSIYFWVIGESKALKIAVKTHHFPIGRYNKVSFRSRVVRRQKGNVKFGNISLIIGIGGVSTKDAYNLIKETL